MQQHSLVQRMSERPRKQLEGVVGPADVDRSVVAVAVAVLAAGVAAVVAAVVAVAETAPAGATAAR